MSIDAILNNLQFLTISSAPQAALDQAEMGNNDLTVIGIFKDSNEAQKQLKHTFKISQLKHTHKTGKTAGQALKTVGQTLKTTAHVMTPVVAGKANTVGNVSSCSFGAGNAAFVAIAGPVGGVICAVSDLTTLYERGKELHAIKKELATLEKDTERHGSLTHRLLHKKRELQRWLVASSVIAVAADGAVLTGSFLSTAGMGAGVGSTGVAFIRALGEEHLNDHFKKDLMALVAEFEQHNPMLIDDKANKKNIEVHKKTFEQLTQKYKNTKANREKAEKVLNSIKDKIEQAEKMPVLDESGYGISLRSKLLYDLEQQKKEALTTFKTAANALKNIERGFKRMEGIDQDFESYKACKSILSDLEPLFEHRDHLKSATEIFETTCKDEYNTSFGFYKTILFNKVNKNWENSVKNLENRLQADIVTNKLLLQQEENSVHIWEDEYDNIMSKIRSEMDSCGGDYYSKRNSKAQDNIKALQLPLNEAIKIIKEQQAKVNKIKDNIKKTTEHQTALKNYKKNCKALFETREKIVLKNRRLKEETVLELATQTLKEQLPIPTKMLLNSHNREKYELFKLQQKLDREELPVVGNDELDEINLMDLPKLEKQSRLEEPTLTVASQQAEFAHRAKETRTFLSSLQSVPETNNPRLFGSKEKAKNEHRAHRPNPIKTNLGSNYKLDAPIVKAEQEGLLTIKEKLNKIDKLLTLFETVVDEQGQYLSGSKTRVPTHDLQVIEHNILDLRCRLLDSYDFIHQTCLYLEGGIGLVNTYHDYMNRIDKLRQLNYDLSHGGKKSENQPKQIEIDTAKQLTPVSSSQGQTPSPETAKQLTPVSSSQGQTPSPSISDQDEGLFVNKKSQTNGKSHKKQTVFHVRSSSTTSLPA